MTDAERQSVEMKELYKVVDAIRTAANVAMTPCGRLMEQRDVDVLNDIASSANFLIGRIMKTADAASFRAQPAAEAKGEDGDWATILEQIAEEQFIPAKRFAAGLTDEPTYCYGGSSRCNLFHIAKVLRELTSLKIAPAAEQGVPREIEQKGESK